jgi:hypothetical protein
MKKLEFAIEVDTNKKKLWDTMLDPVTYKEWVNETWPGSYFEGEWKQGKQLRFISPGRGGTLVALEEVKPYEYIAAKHIAVIRPDGSEDRDSDVAKGWVGTTEAYTFTEKNGKTTLKTTMDINPEWAKMFENDWPKALASLKKIAER